MIYVWGLVSGIFAVVCEIVFRKYGGLGYFALFPYVVIPALLINYGIYKTMSYATHFLEAFIVFSFCTATLRMISTTIILHEALSIQMVVAYGFLVVAQIIKGM